MSTRFQPKKLLLIAAVVALLGGFGWILARSGPLAPTRVSLPLPPASQSRAVPGGALASSTRSRSAVASA